jgi:BolA protein
VKEILRQKLDEAFHPLHLEVIDQSLAHQGHKEAGSAGNSHFKIILVSKAFEGKSPLERHRMVYACLAEEIKQIHAVQLDLRAVL